MLFESLTKRKGWRGFTLVELLVVIAVIATLAALLLPALSGAQAKTRGVQCINVLRNWGTAGLACIDENDGYIPLEGSNLDGSADLETWSAIETASFAWYNVVFPDQAASKHSTDAGRFYRTRILHCPSAKFPPQHEMLPTPLFSLAMNSKLIMPPTMDPHFSIALEQIEKQASTPFFLDGRVNELEHNVGGTQTKSKLGQPAVYATRFAARHIGKGNMAFFDGHVEMFKGEQIVETRIGLPRGQARFPDSPVTWCADSLLDPNN